ncbi:MAG: type II toxin-antitoxin system VapC family toxin, partial [bacterium]
MKYLLDTHALLWIVQEDEKLSKKTAEIYLDPSNEIYFSVVSLWEMAIKINLQKLKIGDPLDNFVKNHVIGNGIRILKLATDHIFPLENLPLHHRDPFDRLLISQSMQEMMP